MFFTFIVQHYGKDVSFPYYFILIFLHSGLFMTYMQTAQSLLWLLCNMARFPNVQEKLYQEIDSVLGKDEDITTKHLVKLPYLKACLKESWRWNYKQYNFLHVEPSCSLTSLILVKKIDKTLVFLTNLPGLILIILWLTSKCCTDLENTFF